MSCDHKFKNDLQLQYVDWIPKILFVGTFNPEWKECENKAEWFYGRTQNNAFWCILPKTFQEKSLINENRNNWIEFCKQKSIAITDIISSISADVNNPEHRDAVCNFKDEYLENFEVSTNNIPKILQDYPTINQICITRAKMNTFWNKCFSETFQFLNLHPERKIKIRLLRSPSRGARKAVVGNFCEFIAKRWLEDGLDTSL